MKTPVAARPPSPAHEAGVPDLKLIPSPGEEGFFDDELLRRGLLAADPVSLVTGLWRGINHVKNLALGSEPLHNAPVPDRIFVPLKGHNHLVLVTEPDPETGVQADEAATTWFKPGLGEFGDAGSALRLHVAYAIRHPERRIVTEATKGMSLTGKPVPLAELSEREIETMAADSLHIMKLITGGAESEIDGTSLGTRLAVAMAEQNLAANPADQLEIVRLKLIASAAVAAKIEGSENFRPPDIDEDEYRQSLSKRFKQHIPADFVRMAYRHPADMLACWPTLATHALAHPCTAHTRLRTMITDYANVKKGTPWSSLKYVVDGMPVDVLGGEHDPLIQEQMGQWGALGRRNPGKVQLSVIEGLGHLMSAHASGTVAYLDQMDERRSPALAVAA